MSRFTAGRRPSFPARRSDRATGSPASAATLTWWRCQRIAWQPHDTSKVHGYFDAVSSDVRDDPSHGHVRLPGNTVTAYGATAYGDSLLVYSTFHSSCACRVLSRSTRGFGPGLRGATGRPRRRSSIPTHDQVNVIGHRCTGGAAPPRRPDADRGDSRRPRKNTSSRRC
jgi:hypothetical protein